MSIFLLGILVVFIIGYYVSIRLVSPSTGNLKTLGRSTWTILHSFARHLDNSNEKDLRRFAEWVPQTIAFYPCCDCRTHSLLWIRDNPCPSTSKEEICQWLCQLHNMVNTRLKKQTYNCNFCDKRWGESKCLVSRKSS